MAVTQFLRVDSGLLWAKFVLNSTFSRVNSRTSTRMHEIREALKKQARSGLVATELTGMD